MCVRDRDRDRDRDRGREGGKGHTHTQTHRDTHIHTHTHAQTHTHRHTHTHIQTNITTRSLPLALFAVVASEGAFDAVLCGFPVALPSPLSSEQLAVLSKALKPGSKLHLQEQGNTAHSEDGATLSFGKREGSVCCP